MRHPKSAGSETHLLSGLKSRICTIRRYVWPAFLRKDQVNDLKKFHIQPGNPSHLVLTLLIVLHWTTAHVHTCKVVHEARAAVLALFTHQCCNPQRSPLKVDAEVMNIIEALDHPQRLSLLHHVTHLFLRGVLVSRLKVLVQEESDRIIASQIDSDHAAHNTGSSGSSGNPTPAPPPPPPLPAGLGSAPIFPPSPPTRPPTKAMPTTRVPVHAALRRNPKATVTAAGSSMSSRSNRSRSRSRSVHLAYSSRFRHQQKSMKKQRCVVSYAVNMALSM